MTQSHLQICLQRFFRPESTLQIGRHYQYQLQSWPLGPYVLLLLLPFSLINSTSVTSVQSIICKQNWVIYSNFCFSLQFFMTKAGDVVPINLIVFSHYFTVFHGQGRCCCTHKFNCFFTLYFVVQLRSPAFLQFFMAKAGVVAPIILIVF